MRKRRELLLNPFIQAAIIYTPAGMGIIKRPADAWSWAYACVLLFSMIQPASLFWAKEFRKNWFNGVLAAFVLWAVVLMTGLLFAGPAAGAPDGRTFRGAVMLYCYVSAAVVTVKGLQIGIFQLRIMNKYRKRKVIAGKGSGIQEA